MEVKYALMTFGIPVSALPFSCDGVYDHQANLENIEIQRKKPPRESRWTEENSGIGGKSQLQHDKDIEEEDPPKQGRVALYPTPNDVLLGRGRSYQDYPGNRRLADWVDQYRERYHASIDRLDKTFTVMEVVKLVQENGGCFLQRTEGGWEVTDDAVSRTKVFHALRAETSSRANHNSNSTFSPGAHSGSQFPVSSSLIGGYSTTTPVSRDATTFGDVEPMQLFPNVPSSAPTMKRTKYDDENEVTFY